MNLTDPLGIRAHFSVVEQATYLAAASVTSSPRSVVEVGKAFIDAKGGVPIELEDMLAQCDHLRAKFATLIHAQPAEVGLLYTTSEAENIIVSALDFGPGDNLVTDELHYSASYVIYEQLAKRGVEIRIARMVDHAISVEQFAPLIDDRTKLLSVAWVSHQTGHRHDLKALATLAHSHGSYLYADIIQGVGMLPLDVADVGIDFCAAGSYKWMLGSFGVAMFYVRESLMDMVRLDRFGSFHILAKEGELKHKLPSDGRKFMYATPAFGPVYQLSAGIDFVQEVGVERLSKHVVGLAHYLRDGLEELAFDILTPAGNQSAIVAFKHGLDSNRIKTALAAENIHVNFREGDSQIRIGSALFNNQFELDKFLRVMANLK